MTELDRTHDSLGLMPTLHWHLSWEALISLTPRSLPNHDRDAPGRGPGKKSSLGFLRLSSSFIISVGGIKFHQQDGEFLQDRCHVWFPKEPDEG